MLEIRSLQKAFAGQPVLRHVDLTIQSGTLHGLVGANGAGKTTLLHCLYGLHPPDAGRIWETSGRPIRELAGLLPYEPYFYPRITGREYIEFCLQARHRPVPDLGGWSEVLELPLNRYAEDYSAGMKKKLALLALLVQNFRYLILDEPFNGLDLSNNLLLLALLRRLREQGVGILLTSHLLGSLTELCDDITVLADGQVLRQYPAAEFAQLSSDLLDSLHQQKLAALAGLLPQPG
ncbi:ATP-binding cassette domain-containing protein [Hymenobacter endophyticus]|uniref:ATP-binding cassette domain-containing protein n=1 Tax=Hymenobacter endophyticus TaxID=3076335 RepID=A0ABU3TC29_9BACT|nr:ATP-binding cassette domain-containing protein [Hymenobacter endophyticus]MDU0368927.1 ATP-binding cassette domain-containing protein [Hymenobacter endophyticus]